ncbi:hypothetical protein FWH30_01975 [Microgenomates group bacterium]|nr:hypothetical protein [Microgenomates group bacterium]
MLKKACLFGFLFLSLAFFGASLVRADEIQELQTQIAELERLKKMSEDATTPLESQLRDIEGKIAAARNSIVKARNELEEIAEDISSREESLSSQSALFKQTVAAQYISQKTRNFWLIFFRPSAFVANLKLISYHSQLQDENYSIIQEISDLLISLNADKSDLEVRQEELNSLQQQLASQASFFKIEINQAKEYQANLRGQIAALSAQQQAIINARAGTTTTAVGDVALADDPAASISFKSQAPSNTFAIFSFGAYTHRNGMSQYGARQRANEGQSAEDILRAYYPGTRLERDYGQMGEIDVQGYGRMSFEDSYLQGIAEMPSSWPIEALKAQAIAARTYAIRSTGNGERSICTTEACQVYNGSRKGGDWERAVNETARWVLVNESDGSPASTQYASTHGGYANTSGWDTTDKSGSGNWADRAWENKANSPWFYKAWYRQGYSSSGNSCGKAHPWLSQEEMSDILNAFRLRHNTGSADAGRIIPITISSCSISGTGGNPYSMAELRDQTRANTGCAVENISSVSTSHNNQGQTANVRFQTNCGEINLSGSEFKETFNLRAPGYLRIPQSSFAFFNIEHKM